MMRETLRRLAAEDNLRTLPEIGIDRFRYLRPS